MLISLVLRELGSRFVGSSSGWLWLIVTPALLLAVYALVFGVIFQARAPANLEVSFVSWLAVALWPWLAFQDAILRASESMPEHGALISKVPMQREQLALASAIAAFVLQLVGYLVVVLLLAALGTRIHVVGLPAALLAIATLAILALGLGLFAAAVRVYWRDLQHLLATLLMMWFFLTPIIYAPSLLPDELQLLVFANPLAGLMTDLRGALLQGNAWPGTSTLILLPVSLCLFAAGLWFFRRLSPFFEDFL